MPRFVLRLLREPARQFDDAGGAGGIVVGAGMHGAGQRGRQGELSAQTQVIVMRADDDVFVGLAGQVSDDVVDGLQHTLHVDVDLA